MRNNTMCGIDITVTHKTKNGTAEINQEAKLTANEYTLLRDVEKFFDDLKSVSRLIRRVMKQNDEIKITFWRCSRVDNYIINEREARYKGYGSDLAENEGCYLVDSRDNAEYDFWLDGSADLFQYLRNFCDEQYYWNKHKRPI